MDAEYNLLVVDDEPVIAESIQRLLSTGLGIPVEVFCAYRGKRALEVLESNRIDLMVSDINMPDMNGLDLLEQVNRRWPACKTIFLTGYPEFTYAYQAFQRHAVGYILKTDEDQVLLDSVQAALDQLKAQLRAASYAPLERSREDLAHIQRLFDAALGAQKSALLADVLPLMGFTQPCERLVFLLSMVPGLQADTDDALLEAAALRHLPGLVRLAPVSHPLPEATLWLGQFEERPSQVYLNGMLEPLQVAFSAASDTNVSFLVGYPGADGEKTAQLHQQLIRHARAKRPDADTPPFVYTLSENTPDTPVSGLLQFIEAYVAEHIREDVSIAQLSLATGYNADYLARLYRQHSGQPLGRYLAERRLDYIRSLMEQPELSLDMISQMSGFSSRSYFNRFIKRETMLTPQRLQALIQHAAPTPEDDC